MKTNPNEPINLGLIEERDDTGALMYAPQFFLGLTKREYFAAMAMQGMASLDIDLKDKVEASVQLADALIKELNK